MLKLCRHKYVVNLFRGFRYINDYYVFMENAEGGDLQIFINRMAKGKTDPSMPWTEERVLKIFAQLVVGLDHVHSKNVIQRDIKGKNTLLFGNDRVKLCDFGTAIVGDTAETRIGDLGFMASEVMNGSERYSKSVDVYSLGIILFTMIFLDKFKSRVDGEIV